MIATKCALGVIVVMAAAPAFALSAPDVLQGHQVFEKWCAGCHNPELTKQQIGAMKPDGTGNLINQVFAGTYVLAQRYKGAEPAALEQRTDLSPEMIKFTVRHGLNMMPRSRKTEISDVELNDIAAYLTRNNR
jgi:mono/diheme cytochrome c family protein